MCAVPSCTSAEVATHRLCANSVYTIPAVLALSEFVLRTSAGAMQDVETASGADGRDAGAAGKVWLEHWGVALECRGTPSVCSVQGRCEWTSTMLVFLAHSKPE